jgi:hypothetical protein
MIRITKAEEWDCIIVGIWNVPEKRYADYFPQKIIDSILNQLDLKFKTSNKRTAISR